MNKVFRSIWSCTYSLLMISYNVELCFSRAKTTWWTTTKSSQALCSFLVTRISLPFRLCRFHYVYCRTPDRN